MNHSHLTHDTRKNLNTPSSVFAAQMGLVVFLATATMLFAGFTSAYIARKASPDWIPIPIPSLFAWNTFILIISSIIAEFARIQARLGFIKRSGLLLGGTFTLGVLFLFCQYLGWRILAHQGLFISTTPHSSFLYILTAVHGLHLLGGLVALFITFLKSLNPSPPPRTLRSIPLSVTYWHFVDIVWVYLFIVLKFF